jgi:hypothetical protein
MRRRRRGPEPPGRSRRRKARGSIRYRPAAHGAAWRSRQAAPGRRTGACGGGVARPHQPHGWPAHRAGLRNSWTYVPDFRGISWPTFLSGGNVRFWHFRWSEPTNFPLRVRDTCRGHALAATRPAIAWRLPQRRSAVSPGGLHERRHRDRVDRSHVQSVVGVLAGVSGLPVLLCRPRCPAVWARAMAPAWAAADAVSASASFLLNPRCCCGPALHDARHTRLIVTAGDRSMVPQTRQGARIAYARMMRLRKSRWMGTQIIRSGCPC